MTPFEQETVIRFDETGSPAQVYTASKRVASKLIKQGMVPYRIGATKGVETAWYFELPKRAVALKPGKHIIRLGSGHIINASVPQVPESDESNEVPADG